MSLVGADGDVVSGDVSSAATGDGSLRMHAIDYRAQEDSRRFAWNDARATLAASEDAYSIARQRYQGGLSNYLDVLVVQDRLLQARLAVAELNADLCTVDVALIRALGGGFDAAAPTPKDETHG